MVSKNGTVFLDKETIKEMIKYLFPIVTLITPNLRESEVLSNRKINSYEDMIKAANIIKKLGCKNVLMKGGQFNNGLSTDVLFNNGKIIRMDKSLLITKNNHGTGCTLSSAITSYLALGHSVEKSVLLAKEYVYYAMKTSPNLGCGGHGPVNHHYVK